MELILGYEILESYKRLPYKTWYALAEFIDNSTQSYRNHSEELEKWYEEEQDMLTVSISYNNRRDTGFVKIVDNAYGMNENELQNALTIGKKPEISNERSKFGVGLKTASFWFGNEWTIETTQRGSTELLSVTINLNKILTQEKEYYANLKKNNSNQPIVQFRPTLDIEKKSCEINEHGTTLEIRNLNRIINGPTAKNCIEYLRSIYRQDLQNDVLYLEFQDTPLTWNQDDIDRMLLKDSNGNIYKKDLNFEVNGKTISGWAGILSSGSRSSGGFALIQADRVIVGYPKNYRNNSLFGAEDGGRNDLTNQRLTGELFLDESFGVSHTKDQILFEDDEEEELDKELFGRLADYKKESNIPYKSRLEKETEKDFDFKSAVETVIKNLELPAFADSIKNETFLPLEVIRKTNEETVERLIKENHSEYKYSIDNIEIKIILSENSSPYDPYLIVRPQGGDNNINVVINVNHTYWLDLGDNNSRFHFLLNCIYDGVAEWKAEFLLNSINPDTIKIIKDSLLRLELKIF